MDLSYEVYGATAPPVGQQKPINYAGTFAPDFCCLVYMKFAATGIEARFAYFDMPRDAAALTKLLEDNFSNSTGSWVGNVLRQGTNFDGWDFGHQQMIYVYVDNADTIRFDVTNPVVFTRFGGRTKPAPGTNERSRNNAFLNAKVETNTILPGGDVLSVENWYCDVAGRPIVDKVQYERYSMNIHLLLKCVDPASGAGTYGNVPIVLDPDPGNMGSNP